MATEDKQYVTLTLAEYQRVAVRFEWPWPCHRQGHVYASANVNCVACGVPFGAYDLEDIIQVARERFARLRAEELPRTIVVRGTSGTVLDLR